MSPPLMMKVAERSVKADEGGGTLPAAGADASGLRVLRHASVYAGGTVLQRGLAFLLLPVITRVLDVSEYGLAGAATATAAFLAIVMGLGMNYAIVRTYFEDPVGAAATRWSALLRAQALIAAVVALAIFLVGPLWGPLLGDYGWGPALQVAVLYAYLSAIQITLQGVLRAAGRPVAFTVVTVIQVIIGGGAGLALAVKGGATGYIVGLCIGTGTAALVAFIITRKPSLWRRSSLTDGFTLGLSFMLHGLAAWGINLSDRVFIAIYLGLAAVGRYQVAYVLGSAVTLLLRGVEAAWMPRYIGDMSPAARKNIPPLVILPVTAVAGAAVGLLVVSAPLLLQLVAPEPYRGTELIVALVAASTLARAPQYLATSVLLDAKAGRSIASASIAGVIVTLGLNFTLIPILGITAAAGATAVSVMVQGIIVLRRTETLLEKSMRLRQLVMIWLGGALILVGISQLPHSGLGMGLRLLVAVGICLFGVNAARWLKRNFRAGHRIPVEPQATPSLA